MTYTIAIGDRTYSSWSLRGWLLFSKFDIPVSVKTARMYTDEFPEMLKDFAPSRTVPAVKIDGEDQAIWDTLAIAETLFEREPNAGVWPKDASARMMARVLASEMHSGFAKLRDECTMNLAHAYTGFSVSDGVKADIARLEHIWSLNLDRFGGPWLCGEYSAADAFYAPVASRIATYGLPVGSQAQAYVNSHLADTAFRQWRAMGIAQNYVQEVYQLDYPQVAWPGPPPLTAHAIENAAPKNANCPYSGQPVVSEGLAEIDGQIIGFCNRFCRDKSVADAEAWPALMDLIKA